MRYDELLGKIDKGKRFPIVNEYDEKYTWKGFLKMLSQCRNRSIDSIGQEFS